MINRKLLEIIDLWSKEEQKEFHIFLSSPYFNKGVQAPVLLQLYALILKYNANPTSPKLQKESVSRHLWKSSEFNKKDQNRLDQLGTRLLALAEQFIAQQDYESTLSEARKLIPLLRFYRKKHLEARFLQTSQAVRKALNHSVFRDSRYYYDEFELFLEVTNNSTPFSTTKKELGVDRADQALDNFYASVKLEMEVTKRVQARLFNAQHKPSPLLDAVRAWIPLAGEGVPVLVHLQDEILKKYEMPPSAEAALALEKEIYAARHLFPDELAKYLFTCSRGILLSLWHKHNDPQVRSQLFAAMERQLAEGYVFIDGKLSTTSLRVFLTISLDLGKTDWARQLLEDFPPERIFGTKYPVEYCKLNWAYYFFHIQDYDKAEKHITHSNFEYQLFGLMAEIQLLKIYYETKNVLLETRMEALQMRVRRSTITGIWKKRLANFLKYLGKIEKLRYLKNKKLQLKTLHEIQSSKEEITEKSWLLEKLNQ